MAPEALIWSRASVMHRLAVERYQRARILSGRAEGRTGNRTAGINPRFWDQRYGAVPRGALFSCFSLGRDDAKTAGHEVFRLRVHCLWVV